MSMLEIPTVELHPAVVEKIREFSRLERAKGGYEAVGFVVKPAKGPEKGVGVLQLHNHASNPSEAFFVEPWEQFRAEEKITREGYGILGVFHSHPNSEALPSRMDHQLARPGEFVFIYSVIFDEIRGYRENDGVLEPVEVKQ